MSTAGDDRTPVGRLEYLGERQRLAPAAARLLHATIVAPDAAEHDRVLARVEDRGQTPEDGPHGPLIRDPSGNGLLIALA